MNSFPAVVVLEPCRLGTLGPPAEDTLFMVSPFSQTYLGIKTSVFISVLKYLKLDELGCAMHGDICVLNYLRDRRNCSAFLCWVLAPWPNCTRLPPARSSPWIRPCIFWKSLFLYQWGRVDQTRYSLFLNLNTIAKKKPIFALLLGFSMPLLDIMSSEGPVLFSSGFTSISVTFILHHVPPLPYISPRFFSELVLSFAHSLYCHHSWSSLYWISPGLLQWNPADLPASCPPTPPSILHTAAQAVFPGECWDFVTPLPENTWVPPWCLWNKTEPLPAAPRLPLSRRQDSPSLWPELYPDFGSCCNVLSCLCLWKCSGSHLLCDSFLDGPTRKSAFFIFIHWLLLSPLVNIL